ncbi:MAG: hypothetical protein V3W44_07300 [Dehalococcoidales bacterium]
MKRGENRCLTCGRWKTASEIIAGKCTHCDQVNRYAAGRVRGFMYGVICATCFLVIVTALLIAIVGCEPEPPPIQERHPTISWANQGDFSVADTVALSHLLPQTYFDVGKQCAVPPRWRMFRWKIPRLGRLVAYNVFWSPPDGTFSVVGVVTPDTTQSYVWVAFDDIEDGDWVALEAAGE